MSNTTEQTYITAEHKILITNEEVRSGMEETYDAFIDKLADKVELLDEYNDTLIDGTTYLYQDTNALPYVNKIIHTEITKFLADICETIMSDREDFREREGCDLSFEVNVEYLLYKIYIKLLDININEIERLKDLLRENNIPSDINDYFT